MAKRITVALFDKIYKVLKSLFSTTFVSVSIEQDHCIIRTEVYKNQKLSRTETKEYKVFDGELPQDAVTYINKTSNKYRFCYLSTIYSSINQGALPVCKRFDFDKYDVKGELTESICVDSIWSVYGYPEDIRRSKALFEPCSGVDFIFSPFCVLSSFATSQKSSNKKMFVMVQKSAVTLAIMDEKKLHYGAYFVLTPAETIKPVSEETLPHLSEGGEVSGVSDELEELTSIDEEGLGELEDLDEGAPIENFQGDEKIDGEIDIKKANESLEEFAKGMDVLNFIKESISEYYKREIFNGEFIDELVFFDTFGMGKDTLEYIEATLLLTLTSHKIEITSALCALAKNEVLEE